jgi:integrase/recombinase XerD
MGDIVTEVIEKMIGTIGVDGCRKLEDVLYEVLSGYEITQRSTELMITNKSWETDLNRFLIRKRTDGKSERTIYNYDHVLRRMLSCINKDVKDITEQDLFAYITLYKRTRKVSNISLENIRLTISSFFGWMHRKGFIPQNPSSGLDPIKVEKRIKKEFSDEDLEKLRISCEQERDLALIEFLYSTGCRVGEVEKLNRSDINFTNMDVTVFGKGGKERETYLTASSCLHLKRYLDSRTDDNPALFVGLRSPHKRLSAACNVYGYGN